jgi:putative ATP-grasp target RiPP
MKKTLKEKLSASALLTPLLLASAPASIQAEDLKYDHEAQMNVNAEGVYANTMGSTTWNGTQTYDYAGNPNDSDNDTDADPFG